jgi:hypothetical protein
LSGNIFCGTGNALGYYYVDDAEWGTTDITVNYSMIASQWHHLGVGNIDADPLFVDPNHDLRLKADSPGIGTGPSGLDMGSYVPGGAAIFGEPDGVTYRTHVTIFVGGPGITHYKYCVNNPLGPWSEEKSVDVPIEMRGLVGGQSYVVFAIGKNSAGRWQSEDKPTISRAWTVDTSHSRLIINEVLAVNDSAVEHEGTFPDLVELYYDGAFPLDLSGMSLTDKADKPRRFVFADGAVIEPDKYLVLYADSQVSASGIHLGFALNGDGEGLYLYDRSGEPVDSVEFGLQLPDLSVGRVGYGDRWQLTMPTFGQANIAQPLGDRDKLKINEWLAAGEVLFDDDFIELFNPDILPVSLSGLYLSDNPETQPDKSPFGPLSFIAGHGFAVFTADRSRRAGHVGFKLSAEGEVIG